MRWSQKCCHLRCSGQYNDKIIVTLKVNYFFDKNNLMKRFKKQMKKNLKQRLVSVNPEKLINILLEIAGNNKVALSKIERLVSNKTENITRFKKHLQEIKKRKKFYFSSKESKEFAKELHELLLNIKNQPINPKDGFKLICAFYKADEDFFEMADDSNGAIGAVFDTDGIQLFIEFSSKLENKKDILEAIVALTKGDKYGNRDPIVKNAYKYLNKTEIKKLFTLFENELKNNKNSDFNWTLTELSKQIKMKV